MSDLEALLADAVGADQVLPGEAVTEDYGHDEALGVEARRPAFVVWPGETAEVAEVLRIADAERVPVTARGSGTGLSGAAVPAEGGLVVCFERMNSILEIDTRNHVAIVQPGVTLAELDQRTAADGLIYPIFPGETSASLGGTIATNAGGMHAVKYGVTRHHVLGLELALAGGAVMRTGGRYVKSSTGYDLTQLIVGSEGTLALVTEAILRLHPRVPLRATLFAPFATLREVTEAIPRIVASGAEPLILEYIDAITMATLVDHSGLELGIPERIKAVTEAYLVVMLENTAADRLDADTEMVGGMLAELGAADVYVLPSGSARQLITAREQAFWAAKAAGADAIVDTVLPRADLAGFFGALRGIGERHGALIVGCGHAGDGNVHLSVFQPDPPALSAVLREIFETAGAMGGAISGEHGIGREKGPYYRALEDPAKLDLMRRIKQVFDPYGILGPGVLFD
jgi:glycolate oxidase